MASSAYFEWIADFHDVMASGIERPTETIVKPVIEDPMPETQPNTLANSIIMVI